MSSSEYRNLPGPSVKRGRVLAAAVLAGLLLAPACGGGDENTGHFEVADIRVDDERGACLDATFPLDPTFFAARDRIDSVGIFMQSRARPGQDADILYLEVLKPNEVREQTGTPIAFGGPPSASTPIRAEVDMGETCPRLNASLRLQGSVQFDTLGTDSGERVAGALLEGTVVDNRSGEIVAGEVTGRWEFVVETEAPHQFHPTYDDEYPVDP